MPDPWTIRVKSSDRAFLCGKTGSGKSYAAHKLTRGLERLVVLDPKGDDAAMADWDLEPWDRDARRRLKDQKSPVRARVVLDARRPTAEIWDEALAAILQAGNVTLYIDEVYGIVNPNSTPSPALTAVWTRGRSLGIGAWAASQRPVWVPLFILSEAEHFFVFRLTLGDDRKRMSEFLGPQVLEVIKDRHGLFYAQAEWDQPRYVSQLP
jgi:DNA helicase HerA-like ATPase